MMTYIEQFHFLRPWWWLAIVPLIIIIIFCKSQTTSGTAWAKVCDAHLLPHLLTDQIQKFSNAWLWVLFMAWLITVFALAGPAWRYSTIPTYQKNINRVIVMDLSDDSLATDVPPSRLIRERYKLLDLLKKAQEGQTGLVVFAGEPYTVSPLTSDSKTIAAMVDNLSPGIMPLQGNNLSSGLQKAKQLLLNANVSKGQIIVISAGAFNKKAKTTAKSLAKQGYTVSILGVGSQQKKPLKNKNGNFLHDEQGNIIFSHFDSNALKTIASAGDGIYVPFTNDAQDITKLLSFDRSQQFKQAKKSKQATKKWQDEGHWFVLLILPLVLFGFRRSFMARIVGS